MSNRPALTKAAVFRFILDTWGRNAFRGYNAHTIPREYDEWLKERDDAEKWSDDEFKAAMELISAMDERSKTS